MHEHELLQRPDANHATAALPLPRVARAIGLRELRDLPAPAGLPLLGNALQIDMPRLHLILERWAHAHGPFYMVRLGTKRILMVSDTAAMQDILQQRPDTFRRLSPIEPVLKELGSHGVFSAEGPSWKRQRKLVMPAFSMRQQRELYPNVALYTERLRAHWLGAAARGEAVNVRRDLMRYTVDVTCRVVFGRDLNTIENPSSELQQHLSRIFNAINRRVNAPLPYWRWLKLPRDHAVERSLRVVHELMRQVIGEARATIARDPARADAPQTLLEAMVVAQRDAAPEERLSDDDISGNVLTLLLAGEDTTSNTLSWMLHYAAHESVVQRRLYEESQPIFGSASVAPRYEDVIKLRYAAAVAQETLRLRSAAPLIFLEAARDATVADIAVPAGTPIFLLTRHAALSDHNFGDAHAFDPQRWLDDAARICAHNPRAALAFGGGPRTCPGRSLALFECAMVLSMVAHNFTLEPVSSREQVEERFDFTMQPEGLRVRFHARSGLAI